VNRRVKNLISLIQTYSLPRPIRQTIRRVRAQHLTYLSEARLNALAALCLSHERQGVAGAIIEAGCALGGSAIVIAASKAKSRKFYIYDVFGMIPPPSPQDGADAHERYRLIRTGRSPGIRGDPYYGYIDNLYDRVVRSFSQLGYPIEENHISLIKGLVQDTLHVTEPVSLAHIDVDWYEPVWTCLERIEPHLAVGGALVIDDYLDWSGCRRAVDDYFKDKPSSLYHFDTSAGSMIITKYATGNTTPPEHPPKPLKTLP
jgi:hypothetical protein